MGYHFPAFLKKKMRRCDSVYPDGVLLSFTGRHSIKTPLLRSMEAISEQAMRIVRLFNKNTTATKLLRLSARSRSIS